jgi:hypothetical protein
MRGSTMPFYPVRALEALASGSESTRRRFVVAAQCSAVAVTSSMFAAARRETTMSLNPKFQVPGGVTPVPNWIFDSAVLTSKQKLVAWGLHRRCYGSSTSTDASVNGIAKAARLDRKTVSRAVEALVELEVLVPDGPRPDGLSQPYKLALERPPKLVELERANAAKTTRDGDFTPKGTVPTPGDSTPHPWGNGTQGGWGFHTQEDGDSTPNLKSSKSRVKTTEDSASLALASATDRPSSGGGGFGIGQSAASAANAEPDVTASPEALGHGQEPKATLPASPGSQYIAPRSRAEINAAFLTPEGLRVSDDPDDLECHANTTLAWVCGEPLIRGSLDALATYGVERCAMWAHWLPRKIADEYSKGRPVGSPSGLYRSAVEGGWEVDPKWPEFDEQRHTVAARAEARKRQEARGDSRRELKAVVQSRLDGLEPSEPDEIDEAFSGTSVVSKRGSTQAVDDDFVF